jgi:hypothetical protein
MTIQALFATLEVASSARASGSALVGRGEAGTRRYATEELFWKEHNVLARIQKGKVKKAVSRATARKRGREHENVVRGKKKRVERAHVGTKEGTVCSEQ